MRKESVINCSEEGSYNTRFMRSLPTYLVGGIGIQKLTHVGKICGVAMRILQAAVLILHDDHNWSGQHTPDHGGR